MSWNYRLSTLESSSSLPTIISNAAFERRLAKYRSLSYLWLRTCTSSKRRSSSLSHQHTIFIPFNHYSKYCRSKVFYDPRHND